MFNRSKIRELGFNIECLKEKCERFSKDFCNLKVSHERLLKYLNLTENHIPAKVKLSPLKGQSEHE